MTRTIDIPTFQASIVRYCSPTLAGIKPAALFTYPGVYASPTGEAPDQAIIARRSRLLDVIARCRQELEPSGIRLSVLVWRPCGALIYVYRPAELAEYLSNPQAMEALAEEGYDTHDLMGSIVHLAGRITQASKNAAECACTGKRCAFDSNSTCGNSCTCEFPHEMGYFLGYPYTDVREFINQRGQNYKALGAWKVYSNVPEALATFARYKACTRSFIQIYQQGRSLGALARQAR